MLAAAYAAVHAAADPAGAGRWVLAAAGVITVVTGALAAMTGLAVKVWRLLRRWGRFLDTWEGHGDTPGVPDRLEAIEDALSDHLVWHGQAKTHSPGRLAWPYSRIGVPPK